MNAETIITFIVTFLSAFGVTLPQPQIDILTMALKGLLSQQRDKDVEEIKTKIDSKNTAFSSGLLALIFAKMGVPPTEVKAMMEAIADSIASQGGLYFIGKKETKDFFKVGVRGMEMLLGEEFEMSASVRGELETTNRYSSFSIGKKYVPEEGKARKEQKEGEYSEACKSLTLQWLKGEIPEQSKSILNFLPAEVPATEELALLIMKKALTDRATAGKEKKESRKRL